MEAEQFFEGALLFLFGFLGGVVFMLLSRDRKKGRYEDVPIVSGYSAVETLRRAGK